MVQRSEISMKCVIGSVAITQLYLGRIRSFETEMKPKKTKKTKISLAGAARRFKNIAALIAAFVLVLGAITTGVVSIRNIIGELDTLRSTAEVAYNKAFPTDQPPQTPGVVIVPTPEPTPLGALSATVTSTAVAPPMPVPATVNPHVTTAASSTPTDTPVAPEQMAGADPSLMLEPVAQPSLQPLVEITPAQPIAEATPLPDVAGVPSPAPSAVAEAVPQVGTAGLQEPLVGRAFTETQPQPMLNATATPPVTAIPLPTATDMPSDILCVVTTKKHAAGYQEPDLRSALIEPLETGIQVLAVKHVRREGYWFQVSLKDMLLWVHYTSLYYTDDCFDGLPAPANE
jgi:hypothetical protein